MLNITGNFPCNINLHQLTMALFLQKGVSIFDALRRANKSCRLRLKLRRFTTPAAKWAEPREVGRHQNQFESVGSRGTRQINHVVSQSCCYDGGTCGVQLLRGFQGKNSNLLKSNLPDSEIYSPVVEALLFIIQSDQFSPTFHKARKVWTEPSTLQPDIKMMHCPTNSSESRTRVWLPNTWQPSRGFMTWHQIPVRQEAYGETCILWVLSWFCKDVLHNSRGFVRRYGGSPASEWQPSSAQHPIRLQPDKHLFGKSPRLLLRVDGTVKCRAEVHGVGQQSVLTKKKKRMGSCQDRFLPPTKSNKKKNQCVKQTKWLTAY